MQQQCQLLIQSRELRLHVLQASHVVTIGQEMAPDTKKNCLLVCEIVESSPTNCCLMSMSRIPSKSKEVDMSV